MGILIINITAAIMSEDKDANVYVVEQVEISSDSDTDELLEQIDDLQDIQNSAEDIQEL